MRKFSQPQNPNPTDLRVQRRHKKRAGKVERDTARVFYMRLSHVRLKIQFNSIQFKILQTKNRKERSTACLLGMGRCALQSPRRLHIATFPDSTLSFLLVKMHEALSFLPLFLARALWTRTPSFLTRSFRGLRTIPSSIPIQGPHS